MKTKGQGGLETLLLIGGAIIVAAIVTTLVLGVGNSGGSVAQKNVYSVEKQKQQTLYGYSVPGGVSNSGLVYYFNFNDGTLKETVTKTLPTNLGVTVGTDATHGSVGVFNGSSTMYMPSVSGFEGDVSIAFWAKLGTNPYNWPIFVDKGTNTREFSVLSAADGKAYAANGDGSPSYVNLPSNSAPFSNGTWVHVTFTRSTNPKTMKLYINGNFESTTNYSLTVASSSLPVYIGSRSGANYFNGNMDDILIFKRVLSDPEVRAIYNDSK